MDYFLTLASSLFRGTSSYPDEFTALFNLIGQDGQGFGLLGENMAANFGGEESQIDPSQLLNFCHGGGVAGGVNAMEVEQGSEGSSRHVGVVKNDMN